MYTTGIPPQSRRVDPPGMPMDFALAVYDALVAVNVPPDRARQVVDSLQRDMETQLATKKDLRQLEELTVLRFASLEARLDAGIGSLRQEGGAEAQAIRATSAAEFSTLRAEIGGEFRSVRADMASEFQAVRAEMASGSQAVRAEIATTALRTTVTLGSVVVATAGIALTVAGLLFR
jgi:hypothetical protein